MSPRYRRLYHHVARDPKSSQSSHPTQVRAQQTPNANPEWPLRFLRQPRLNDPNPEEKRHRRSPVRIDRPPQPARIMGTKAPAKQPRAVSSKRCLAREDRRFKRWSQKISQRATDRVRRSPSLPSPISIRLCTLRFKTTKLLWRDR